ncbi:MAG: cytochrome C, partial [Acidobacteria bacterium]
FGIFPLAIYFIVASYLVYLVMNATNFTQRIFRRMTLLQIVTTDLLLVLMLALPVKILLRLIFRIKYIWVTPWFSI